MHVAKFDELWHALQFAANKSLPIWWHLHKKVNQYAEFASFPGNLHSRADKY